MAALLALTLLGVACLAGCSDDAPAPPATQSDSSSTSPPTASDVAAAGSGQVATAFPVPATPSPSPLPALGTRENADWTLVLNGVRRLSPDSLLVEATVTPKKATGVLTGLEESGYLYLKDTVKPSLEFSAVTVLAQGSPVEYRVMRDEAGACACTQGVNNLKQGDDLAVYAVVTAPRDATSVTVVVRGFAPFAQVALS